MSQVFLVSLVLLLTICATTSLPADQPQPGYYSDLVRDYGENRRGFRGLPPAVRKGREDYLDDPYGYAPDKEPADYEPVSV